MIFARSRNLFSVVIPITKLKPFSDAAQRDRPRRDGGERRILRLVWLLRSHSRPKGQQVQLGLEEEYRLPS